MSNSNSLSEETLEERLENTKEVMSDNVMSKFVKISLYISIWVLSCSLLYTYWIKHKAKLEYNKLITEKNTKDLEHQMLKLKKISEKYSILLSNNINENDNTTGIKQLQKKLYDEMIMSLNKYDKCNYIKFKNDGIDFPYSEVMISTILLLIVTVIIAVYNVMNNPMQMIENLQGYEELKSNIMKTLDDKLIETSKKKTGGELSGDFSVDGLKNQMSNLQSLDMLLSTYIKTNQIDPSFNQFLLSFSILLFSTYIAFNMFIKSTKYRENLFSGKLFMKSKCYN
jgi:hypothetical protein